MLSRFNRIAGLHRLSAAVLPHRMGSDLSFSKQRSDFLFGEAPRSFRSLGLNAQLCAGLEDTGKEEATIIQALTFAPVVAGKNIVISAETGTGKTLAYLCPLLHRILDPERPIGSKRYPVAVIMVPNKELGLQVQAMAKGILTNCDSTSLIGTVWELDYAKPFSRHVVAPSILIATPNFLAKFVKGARILDDAFFGSIQHLVLDEDLQADLLLEGDYLKQIENVMTAFQSMRRQQIKDGYLKVHEDPVQKILSAATLPTSGKKSVSKYVEHNFGNLMRITNENVHKHHPRITQNFVEIKGELSDEVISPVAYVDSIIDSIYQFSDEMMSDNRHNLATSFLDIESKQHSLISQTCIEFDNEHSDDPHNKRDTSRVESFEGTENDTSSIPLTIIFANTAQHAMELTEALSVRRIPCGQYHKLVRSSERIRALEEFKNGKVPILVATDLVARGLDVPQIRHIIQAEFAENVVQHLHRIGRSSRGGLVGHATNFFSGKHSSAEENGDVEQSFSRRRGLRRRLKRYESLQENTGSASS